MKAMSFILFACSLIVQTPGLSAEETLPADAQIGPASVVETIDVGNYIYLRLEDPDIWIATSPLEVVVGDQVSFSNGAEMRNFYSKILDRTFESILFVSKVSIDGRDIAKLHKSAMEEQSVDHPVVAPPEAVPAPVAGEIEALEDGQTVASIVADSIGLNGQSVRLRARVIKVSANVMGKNWITLQDGSGTAPDNKLLATSSETPAPGDLVIAAGTLRKDVDIGSGYTYKVLLEEAAFSQ